MKQRTLSALVAFAFGLLLTLMTSITLNAAASIGGFVWNDLNTNGIQDAGEPGLNGVWVFLLDLTGNQVGGDLTDANGNYSFEGVAAGAYVIRFANPGGVWQTLQNQGDDSKDSDADPLGYTAQFSIADGQALDFDAGFTTVPQGCFTPITVTISAIACNDNGTPNPNDDTFTFAITATGGTGPWGWDMLPGLMMIPYGTSHTFGPFQIVNGAVTLTINDHDNPACTATFTVSPPAPCSSPAPSVVSMNCPNNISATTLAGGSAAIVTFSAPAATTTCPSGSATVTQISGPASGSAFPVGTTEVCFKAADPCGSSKTCCFNVTVTAASSGPDNCDEKTIGCIYYELLDIKLDAVQNRTYRIRVTNNCTNELIYTAIQLPDGVTALAPPDNSTYTAPSGRTYLVRNPNPTPFHSIRFKSQAGGISSGQSDIFSYTLPQQSAPHYIHVIAKVYPQAYYEAHLNTFNCVPMNAFRPEPEHIETIEAKSRDDAEHLASPKLKLYPNPTAGALFADLSAWEGQPVKISVLNSQGNLLQTTLTEAGSESFPLNIENDLPNGLYFVEVIPTVGLRQVQQVVLQR